MSKVMAFSSDEQSEERQLQSVEGQPEVAVSSSNSSEERVDTSRRSGLKLSVVEVHRSWHRVAIDLTDIPEDVRRHDRWLSRRLQLLELRGNEVRGHRSRNALVRGALEHIASCLREYPITRARQGNGDVAQPTCIHHLIHPNRSDDVGL